MILLIIAYLLVIHGSYAQTSIGYIYTSAGGGSGTNSGFSGDGSKATSAALNTPFGVVVDTSGNIYIGDSLNYRVRKVTILTGIISTIGGTGFSSYSGDNGQATSANMYPYGIALDSSANVYFADVLNQRIRKITVSTGIVSTVAGTGVGGYSSDNVAATSANIYSPQGITVDTSGNIFIADTGNDRIRKVTSGTITTVAGNGDYIYNGDNKQATSATLYNPTGVEVDSSGNIYIADQWNHRIRKVTVSTGIITTIAGTGSNGYSGNGVATSCKLNYPQDVAVDASGAVYITDSDNDLLRKISSGTISTLAGTYGYYGYSGDYGVATSSTLNGPGSVCLDSFSNIYIADTYNYRIRKIVTSSGVYTAAPTRVPTRVPTAIPTAIPTRIPTVIPTRLPTAIPIALPTAIPTRIPTVLPTAIPTKIPSFVPTALPTRFPTVTPTAFPSSVPTSLPTSAPTVSPTTTPTCTPTSMPTVIPTTIPTFIPTTAPTSVPTMLPSFVPTLIPTVTPSSLPSTTPTVRPSQPTFIPTFLPTFVPTQVPTFVPSATPTIGPTFAPSYSPSFFPSSQPSSKPSSQPSSQPSSNPTTQPSGQPSSDPTAHPSAQPTRQPSRQPSSKPTSQPTSEPTQQPSAQPTSQPSAQPTSQPSTEPSSQPSGHPTSQPSSLPTSKPSTSHPTCSPTYKPTPGPTSQPTSQPSYQPSGKPTLIPSSQPTMQPTSKPSTQPTSQPSTEPSSQPSGHPTSQPSSLPTSKPSTSHPTCSPTYKPTPGPTSQPSSQPSSKPTREPSGKPSGVPSIQPSSQPSSSPSSFPSGSPSNRPTNLPSSYPSTSPSSAPSSLPSSQPSALPSSTPSSQPTSYPSSPSSLPSSFPTSEPTFDPTSQPSAQPTSQPSDAQRKSNSNFELNTSSSVLASKLKYYLASFIAYFILLYLLLWLLDKSKLGKNTSDALHTSAFNSKMYLNTASKERRDFIEALSVKNKLVKLSRQDTYIASKSDQIANRGKDDQGLSTQENPLDIESEESSSAQYNRSDGPSIDRGNEVIFTDAFYHYILQKRCLIGCNGVLYPKGFKLNLLIASLDLPVGMFEDFLIHLYNNHSLFSCIFSVKGSPISRNACRIVYIVQNCIAFFIFSFTNMVYEYVGLSNNFSILSDLLITSPLSLFFGSIAIGLYTCPVVNNLEFEQSRLSRYKKSIITLGRFMIIPFLGLIFGLLLLSALCTNRSNISFVIFSFIWQVQLQSFVLELIYATLLFKSTFYYQIKMVGVPLIEVGCLFAERVVKSYQNEYYMYYSRHFHGLFVRDYITSTRFSRLQVLATESHSLNEEVQDSNRISASLPGADIDEIEVFENPLLTKKKASRLSMISSDKAVAAPYPTLSLDSYDPEKEIHAVTIGKNKFQTVTLNPLLGSSANRRNDLGNHTTQRESDIQLADLHGSRAQKEYNIDHAVEDGTSSDDEFDDTFDDDIVVTDSATPTTSSNEAHKRGTAYVGYDTAYQKPKVGTANPLHNKITNFKDEKHNIKNVKIHEDEENDDELYEEFQAFRIDSNRRSEVGLDSEGDEISFEDWKIKRKELRAKEESYVNAFRFFERREQETGAKVPKFTASQQRAIGLHVKFGKRASLLKQDETAKEIKPESTSTGNTRSI